MSLFKIIGYYLISIYGFLTLMLSYNKLIKSKLNFSTKTILVILIGSLIFTINLFYSASIYKLAINILAVYIASIITSKENLSKTLVNVIIMYLMLFVIEIITSSVVMLIDVVDMNMFDSNLLLKAIISFVELGSLYLLCSIKYIINIANKISGKIKNNKLIVSAMFLSIIILVITDIRFFETFSSEIYIGNFIILLCLIVIMIFAIKSYLDSDREKQKTEALLSFMSKYEKIIDEDRVTRHQLLNDLLVLKSISNKNSKEYNNILDELIDKFTNKGIKIKNIYNLPSGLKGFFYYKLYGLDDKGYDININVSKSASNSLKNIKYDDFVSLYKIVGIVLDNAIEASSKTNKKYILIDIYEQNDIIIEVSNSYKGKIDIDKINDKYYSSKGKNRGLGLYIVNNIVKNNENILNEQTINNGIFNTKITIKK